MTITASHQASPPASLAAVIAGVCLSAVAAACLWQLAVLVGYVAVSIDSSVLWRDYAALAAALTCAFVAGVSLVVSGVRRRRRDLVPGPTLYLLGLAMVAVAAQGLLVGASAWLWLLAAAGFALLVLEYRLDVL